MHSNGKKIILTTHLYFNMFNINIFFVFLEKLLEKKKEF